MNIYLVLDRSLTLPDFDVLEQLRERLAELEHLQWAHLTEHVLNNATEENILRWKHQMDTPYNELSEEDKNKDREWADKVLLILMNFISLIFLLIIQSIIAHLLIRIKSYVLLKAGSVRIVLIGS